MVPETRHLTKDKRGSIHDDIVVWNKSIKDIANARGLPMRSVQRVAKRIKLECAQSNDADDRDTHDSMAPEYQGMEEDADYAGEVYDGAPSAKCPRVTKDNEQ
eukprot:GEMP01114618.1.p1 GENE.GEMP01114618.1~~GEMP01114618.1.p1  ORF type:complete len:103 (+),score=22.70 GEMP01114618.1:50-358(+)